MNVLGWVLVSCFMLFLGSANAQRNAENRGGERLSAPADQGLDLAVLAEMQRRLPLEYPSIRGVVILRHGKPAFELYRDGLNSATLHDARFATASFVSALVGIALQQGLIKSVNQPISTFLPEALEAGVDSRVRSMTLEQVLTLTAGFDPSVRQVGKWAFPVDFALRRPLVSDPGSAFSFNPGTAHLAARVLVGATKKSMSNFAKRHLFEPLQIERFLWRIDGPGGNELGYAGLQLTARDMAKLGQLYLQGGVWNGKALLPATYVESATRKQNNGGPPLGWSYGYLWWVGPTETPSVFMAGADDGQRIYVNRALDLVAVVTADAPRGKTHSDVDAVLNNFVLRSVKR